MNRELYIGAKRLEQVAYSPVRRVLEKARELESQGKQVIHFEIGEPDFDTPEEISHATAKALLEDRLTHYASNRGYPALLKTIAKKLKEENGIEADPKSELIITTGAVEAIADAIFAYIDPEDEVICFTPGYMNYWNCIFLAGGQPIFVKLKEENGYNIDENDIRAAITPRTKMIILSNPHNPTGAVFSRDGLEIIATIARESNLLVLSDEIYEHIVYDGVKCESIATLEGMKERTIIVNGFSKSYAMTGWRIGYLWADKRLIPNMLKVHQYVTNCIPTFIQAGIAEAMYDNEVIKSINTMVETFSRRRELLVGGLSKIEGINFVRPQGAFYVMVNISSTGLDCVTFAEQLLAKQNVAVVPASGFGNGFEYHIRIAYSTSEEDIIEGIRRIEEFVKSL